MGDVELEVAAKLSTRNTRRAFLLGQYQVQMMSLLEGQHNLLLLSICQALKLVAVNIFTEGLATQSCRSYMLSK